MTTGAVGIRRVGQIAITVRNVETATAFYRDVLGLRHLFDAPPKMSFFDCGGTRLLLGESEDAAVPGDASAAVDSRVILYLDVADIAAAHAALESRSVRFSVAPHKVADLGDRELRLAFFADPDGNNLALMSEQLKIAAG